jgi:hypothetical protein
MRGWGSCVYVMMGEREVVPILKHGPPSAEHSVGAGIPVPAVPQDFAPGWGK